MSIYSFLENLATRALMRHFTQGSLLFKSETYIIKTESWNYNNGIFTSCAALRAHISHWRAMNKNNWVLSVQLFLRDFFSPPLMELWGCVNWYRCVSVCWLHSHWEIYIGRMHRNDHWNGVFMFFTHVFYFLKFLPLPWNTWLVYSRKLHPFSLKQLASYERKPQNYHAKSATACRIATSIYSEVSALSFSSSPWGAKAPCL